MGFQGIKDVLGGGLLVSNARFRARYVIFLYLVLAFPVLLFTRTRIRRLFTLEDMLARHFSEEDVAKVLGGNMLRVFRQVWDK